MTYQVLARKYRPQNFDAVVGQDHVTTTLKNAILKNRLHHAYLFTGVRGTGKTSLARILAKSINCELGPSVTPCEKCSNCEAITQGQFLDVMEIDGASNTSVESVRELREQIKYLPAAGRYKVYIIDEVHMLSTSAFNALLKTLEEPPSHVLFIFATTEAHKIPVTILSRCQRFDLKRLSHAQIIKRLQWICEAEKITSDSQSFEILSRAAEGSMRDAQSLLDMAIGVCGEALQAQAIHQMLGLTERTWIHELSKDCLQGRLQEGLAKVQSIYDQGYDLRQVIQQWVEYWHDLALLKSVGPEALGDCFTSDSLKTMQTMIQEVDLADLQVIFQTVYHSSEEIFRSEAPKILFDLLLVKLMHGSPYHSLASILSSDGDLEASLSPRGIGSGKGGAEHERPLLRNKEDSKNLNFSELMQKALKKKPQIKALLDNAIEQTWEEDQLIVTFPKGSMWAEMLEEKRSDLVQALSEARERSITVQINQSEKNNLAKPEAAKHKHGGGPETQDPVVREALEVLNAKVEQVKRL